MNTFLKKQNLKLPLSQSKSGFAMSWQKIAGGIAVLGIVIFGLNFFQSPIKNMFYAASAPLSKSFWQAGESTSGFLNPFFNVATLSDQNTTLKQENEQLLLQISLLQNNLRQNQAMQEIVANTQGDAFNLVVAQTMGLDAANDVMLVDKGLQDGIAQNMPVISSTKVLVGKVVKVYKNFSQVMLITHKQSVIDVSILLKDQKSIPIKGAIKGSGNLAMYLDLIPSDAKINPGDTLVSSGQEGTFPKNLLMGKITSVDNNDLKPFQTAQLQPLFDSKNIDTLFIITDYKKP